MGELPEETRFCRMVWDEVRWRRVVAILSVSEEGLQLYGAVLRAGNELDSKKDVKESQRKISFLVRVCT